MSNGYNGWNSPLMVTLTATSNKFLAAKLPLQGQLHIHEMGTDGYAMGTKITFLEMDSAGNPVGSEVAADHAEFSYTSRVASNAAKENAMKNLGIARDAAYDAGNDLASLRDGSSEEVVSSPEFKERLLAAQKRSEETLAAWFAEQEAYRGQFGRPEPLF